MKFMDMDDIKLESQSIIDCSDKWVRTGKHSHMSKEEFYRFNPNESDKVDFKKVEEIICHNFSKWSWWKMAFGYRSVLAESLIEQIHQSKD